MTGEEARAPDGIEPRHWQERDRLEHLAGLLALLSLTVVVLSGALGVFGLPDQTRVASTSAADLHAFGPRLIRNGEFFEMRFYINAKQPIQKPVLAVDPEIWEDITINTFIPAPVEESHERGAFRFTFGKLDAEDELLVKVDGQINPDFRGSNSGPVQLFDGEREVTGVHYDLLVLP